MARRRGADCYVAMDEVVMSEFLILAAIAVSAVVGVSGVLIYLLLGPIRAGLASCERVASSRVVP